MVTKHAGPGVKDVPVEGVKAAKVCDNKSVGMIVVKDDKVLLIERRKFPYGFAPPAGHLDGDEWEEGARRELKEEVGLNATKLTPLKEEYRDNPCRREGGDWHYWKIYAVDAEGEVSRSLDETKRAGWYSKDQVRLMMERTERYMAREIPEDEWKDYPGMEPVWYWLFKELNIVR